ncbi:hypothetical protein [Microbulbifer thermotolerans]|uniref:Uncharacterized protein n=1 Tax=Microbulbifer thermotolerans TaxID=252514 RepID=A0AB35I0U4_MICTH|nr:hypothetical protein [Microbulbifer thermotolerans]MCX2803383.1 hypothetical protein [Microbulbifer thermotolerans]
MITNLINVLNDLLPLVIKEISWDGDTFIIAGDEWSFSTTSAWRIIKESSIDFACWDNNIDTRVDKLKGLSLVAVQPQGSSIHVDPAFQLSDGRRLEVFSTETVEPWAFTLPGGSIYVGAT